MEREPSPRPLKRFDILASYGKFVVIQSTFKVYGFMTPEEAVRLLHRNEASKVDVDVILFEVVLSR